MDFNRSGHRDDLMFVVAVVLPMLAAGARYLQSDQEITQIAQAQEHRAGLADAAHRQQRQVLAHNQVR